MSEFKVNDIVLVPTANGGVGVGQIKKIETLLDIESAWVDVLGGGQVLYGLDQLKVADLRKLTQ